MPTPDENDQQLERQQPKPSERAESAADRIVTECLERARLLQKQGNLKGAFLACQTLLIERYEQIPKDRLAEMYDYMADLSELQDNRQRAERYRQKAASLASRQQAASSAPAAEQLRQAPAMEPARPADTPAAKGVQDTAAPQVDAGPVVAEEPRPAGRDAAEAAEGAHPAELSSEETSRAPSVSLLVAGVWRRLLAGLVDLVLIVATTLLSVVLSAIVKGEDGAAALGFFTERLSLLLLLLAMIFVFWLAYVTIFCVFGGQTAGQMLLGLKVVDRFGHTPGWSVAVRRMVGLVISVLAGCAGLVWIAFDAERRGWHDRLAGTVVIRLAQVGSTEDAVGGRSG